VYRLGPGVEAPVLLNPAAVAGSRDVMDKCASRNLLIAAVIDADGEIAIRDTQQADYNKCVVAAMIALKKSGFQAGTLNSKPVPILLCVGFSSSPQAGQTLPGIQPCPENLEVTTLDGQPVYRVGGAVKPPFATNQVNAEFSEEARRANYQGVCLIELVVDAKGHPQNARVVVPLGMGLDQKALEAVRRYRFKPATFEGKPVPAPITIEINFRLFQRLD
jgi:TonB family protein